MRALRLGFILSLAIGSIAQTPRGVTLQPGRADQDGFPESGAKFCLASPPSACFQMPSLQNRDVTYEFGLEPHAQALHAPDGETWFLFDAMFSGGGSGTLTRYAVLRPSGGALINLLPRLALTNVSELQVLNEPSLSPYPLLATADFIWNTGESHFGSHHFEVSVWRFDPARKQFSRDLRYSTAHKYAGSDDADDPPSVLKSEHAEILRRLHSGAVKH